MAPTDLDLDLEVFQGPFDLLLALVLREEVELAEVPIAEIVVAFLEECERRGELDLEAATEFLVLVAALLELKVRLLVPGEDDEDGEGEGLSREEAHAELLARLLRYRRFARAAGWLGERGREPRIFREGPAALAPRPHVEDLAFSEDPWDLHASIGRLLRPPPAIDLSGVRRRLVPVRHFLDVLRRLLAERRAFSFEEAVDGLDRMGQATAFVALLELVKRGEAGSEQESAFGPIRVVRGPAARERAIA